MDVFQLLMKATLGLMTVFLLGSIGEIITEKSGHLNLGIPGIMALGGLGGVVGATLYLNNIANPTAPNQFLVIFIPIIFGLLFGAVGGLFFSFFAVTLRCNQNVVGLCLTMLGVGISTYFLTQCGTSSDALINTKYLPVAGRYFQSCFFPNTPVEEKNNFNFFMDVFCNQGFLCYLSVILTIIVAFVINKTRTGLSLKAVGENPAAADSIGINITKYRYVATIIGSAIAALGGVYLLLDRAGGGDPAGISIEPYGWLAVALVIFSMWKPGWALVGSILFALFYTLPGIVTGANGTMKEFLKMIPYLMTIVILIITSMLKLKNNQPPAGLGQSYFREDR